MSDYARELEVAGLAAREAGAIILDYYARGTIAVEIKADASPVTAADRAANTAIVARLRTAFPDDAILSEESPDDPGRMGMRRAWIVDPLDGTRDFIARTGDFCVHVGLAVDGVPAMGAVFQPVTGALYTGARGGGAFVEENGQRRPLRVSGATVPATLRVGVSRANATGALQRLLARTGLAGRAVPMGASVKLMALARGDLDVVINVAAGEQEWDTCAPEAVLREAGGRFSDADGHPFGYNQRDVAHRRGSIASNGACHEVVLGLCRPHLAFEEEPAP